VNAVAEAALIQQHLIDPEICIRCNTCEATCPVGAITHDDRNYVVDASKCNACMACISPCPTGSIDHWRQVPRLKAYSVIEQLGWEVLPAPLSEAELALAKAAAGGQAAALDTELSPEPQPVQAESVEAAAAAVPADASAPARPPAYGSTLAPWSAAHPYTQLYGPRAARASVKAKVTGNVRVTAAAATLGEDYDTHHLVLDFGTEFFPVLEGQSIGIVPPGKDASGRPHHPRQYSVASPRNGERPGYNNVSLTVKRVLEDHQGRPVRGVASNFLCDLKVGDEVEVVGPFGTSFLMPNHAGSTLVMICTGTGSAPMRAMTEWRRRQRAAGGLRSAISSQPAASQSAATQPAQATALKLFFGARTQEELPYFGPLQNLPPDFIDIHFAFSRTPGQPKRYVQDAMRDAAASLLPLLQDPNAYFYVCGLKAMEEGVLQALQDIAEQAGLAWPEVGAAMKAQGRLHLETY
jgi:benzoyl-CoA 2,3-dioxygenase component A